MTWFQIWTVSWQVAVLLTPLMLGAAVLWLKSQFVTKVEARAETIRTNAEFTAVRTDARAETNRIDGRFDREKAERDQRYEGLRDRAADFEGRLKAVEADLSRPPTRHTLNNELTKVVAQSASLEKAVSGLGRQIDTVQTYLHTIVEQGMKK